MQLPMLITRGSSIRTPRLWSCFVHQFWCLWSTWVVAWGGIGTPQSHREPSWDVGWIHETCLGQEGWPCRLRQVLLWLGGQTFDKWYIIYIIYIYLFILRNWIKGKSIGHPYILMENLWIPAIVPFYNFESSIISIPMAQTFSLLTDFGGFAIDSAGSLRNISSRSWGVEEWSSQGGSSRSWDQFDS